MHEPAARRITPWILSLALLGAAAAPHAAAEEETGGEAAAGAAGEAPPQIRYRGSRTSSGWIALPSGSRVAVDRGVTWQGVTVYLSLTNDLVGVDAATDEVLYGTSVGAFWRALTFRQVTPQDGVRRWAIELAPHQALQAGADLRQYHDLRTGEKLAVPALDGSEPGVRVEGTRQAHGDVSHVAEPFVLLLGTEAGWQRVQEHVFGPGAGRPELGPIDFGREVVLLVASGDAQNCRGLTLEAAYEDETRVLLQTGRESFQTMDGYHRGRPWGAFVLPRRPDKHYVVLRNIQGLIGGPPIWQRLHEFAGVPAAQDEAAVLPARTDAAYHGWTTDGGGRDGRRPPPKSPPR